MDQSSVFFYVEARDRLSAHRGRNWMLLLIDADQDQNTGWYGYDYIVNKRVLGSRVTTLMKYAPGMPGDPWVEVAPLSYLSLIHISEPTRPY